MKATAELERSLATALRNDEERGGARVLASEVRGEGGQAGLIYPADSPVTISLSFELNASTHVAPALRVSLDDGRGPAFWSIFEPGQGSALRAGQHTVEMKIPACFLAVGPHKVSGALVDLERDNALLVKPTELVSFMIVEENDPEGSARGPHVEHSNGLIRPRLDWAWGDLDEANGAAPKPKPHLDEISDDADAELVSATIADEKGQAVGVVSRGSRATIELVWRLDQACIFAPSFAVIDQRGSVVFRSTIREHDIDAFACPGGHRYGIVWLPLSLLRPGQYLIEAAASDPRTRPLRRYFREAMASRFSLVGEAEASSSDLGPVRAPVEWRTIVGD